MRVIAADLYLAPKIDDPGEQAVTLVLRTDRALVRGGGLPNATLVIAGARATARLVGSSRGLCVKEVRYVENGRVGNDAESVKAKPGTRTPVQLRVGNQGRLVYSRTLVLRRGKQSDTRGTRIGCGAPRRSR
ncbi:MAG: hypothetical protein ACR2NB_07980 [Solirubrobacteraceae bacterium]